MTMAIRHIAHPRRYPPRVTEFTQQFWNALAQGRFLVTRCTRCEHRSFPPKPICPVCWAGDIIWSEVDTTGRLYSWTRVHAGPAIFDPDLPYAIGIVDLDIGVRLASPLVGGVLLSCCDGGPDHCARGIRRCHVADLVSR